MRAFFSGGRIRRFLLVFASVWLLVSFVAAPVQALTSEEQTNKLTDGAWWEEFGCAVGAIGASLVNGDNPTKAYYYFTGKGLTAAQAAGIVGNLIQESGVNPKSKQGGGGPGRGIAQWSVDGRWATFLKWAKKNGNRDIYDLATQLDFMWYEMNHAPHWKESLPAIKSVTGDSAAAASRASAIFGIKYEAYGKAGARNTFAERIWRRFHGKNASPTSAEATGSDACGGTSGECQGAPAGWVQNTNRVVDIACIEWNRKVIENGGSHNCDKRGIITSYVRAVGGGSCGPPYCGYFVGYVYKKAGHKFPAGAGVQYVPTLYAYLHRIKAYRSPSSTPTPGDVVTYGTSPPHHTGLVVGVNTEHGRKMVTTIEGNTGPDSSDKVNKSGVDGVHMHHRPYPGVDQSAWGNYQVLSSKQK